ncbi:MAG: tRNA epoxyqueuosine(34) reductase QueG, partial [Litorimonas sp.]
VCPWNKFAHIGRETKLAARDDLNAPALADLAALGEDGFRHHFAGSPIKRIGWNRFLRNVLYAIGNSGRPELRAAAQAHALHEDSTISGAVKWCLHRL